MYSRDPKSALHVQLRICGRCPPNEQLQPYDGSLGDSCLGSYGSFGNDPEHMPT